MRLLLLPALLAVVVSGCVGDGRSPASPPRVGSMAALGDSITQAVNVDGARPGESAWHSWATGHSAGDGVESHRERLGSEVGNRSVNLARSGARMADLPRQAEGAVGHGAEYVTVLMGSNDACAPSVDAMTPVDEFRRSFREAARILDEGLPEGAVVFVASVPDATQLREALWDNAQARTVWRTFRVCQALLADGASAEDVEAVRDRLVAYNRVLREESERFGFRFDDEAVFRTQLRPGDVSSFDFFHPSLEGQRRLAEITWKAGPWAGRG